jgi:hypothetical protein
MKTKHNQNKQKLSRKKRLREQIERKKKQKRGGKQGRERAGSDELDAWGRVRS